MNTGLHCAAEPRRLHLRSLRVPSDITPGFRSGLWRKQKSNSRSNHGAPCNEGRHLCRFAR
jgi:hypothetical protein